MKTLQQFIDEAILANPQPQYKTINGEKILLTDAEHNEAIYNWATMKLEQQQTTDEAQALLG